MIRRAFFRRMAHAAMAGMLGAELMLRAPRLVDDPSVVRYYTTKAIEGLEVPPTYPANIFVPGFLERAGFPERDT